MSIRRDLVIQIAKYCAIGMLNTLVNAVVFNGLIAITGISVGAPVIGFSFMGFVVVVFISFFLNKRWVFHKQDGSAGRQFAQFFAVSGGVVLINLGLMAILINRIGAPMGISTTLWANIALAITIVVSVIGNFVGYKWLVFR